MWRSRTSHNFGTSVFSFWVGLALICASVSCSSAFAAACYTYTIGGQYASSSAQQTCSDWGNAYIAAANQTGSSHTPYAYQDQVTSGPTANGLVCQISWNQVTEGNPNCPTGCPSPGGTSANIAQTSATCGPSPNCSAGSPAFVGGASAPGDICVDGCEVDAPNPPLSVGGGGGGTVYESTQTGNGCSGSGQSNTTSGYQAEQCTTSGGTTACADTSGGGNCGTFNGDYVCPKAMPDGTCQVFQSGGVACTVGTGTSPATPPAPNNGTAGTVATPAGSVTDNTTNQTSYYYSAAVVNSSTTPVVSASPGSNVGNGGSSSSSGGGGGSGPNAANGDCGAQGVSCSGTTPTYDWSGDCASFQVCLTDFYNSASSAPIVAGASSIIDSWPEGSCDIGSVTFETFGNKTMDYGTTACQVWSQYIQPPLSAVMDGVWAILGILIILSA